MEDTDLLARFENVEDLSDPTLIDDLQMVLEQIQAEDEEFMQILLDKIESMVITWEQPWYQEPNCLTRPLKVKDDDVSQDYRTDTICSEERELISKNWKDFRKTYGVPNKPACLARWRNKDKSRHPNTPEELVRRFVMAYLARGLNRTIYQVYKFFITHYGNRFKGRYSVYEEKIMLVCMYHNPKNVVPYLSAVLGREPRGIYKKLLQLSNGKKTERNNFKWTLPLCTKFLKLMMKYTGEPLENLQNKRFGTSIWVQLEEAMGKEHICLQMFWYNSLHVQLFVRCDIKINKLRKKILKKLKLYPYKIWSDIRWKEILKHFPDGFTHGFLYKTTSNIFRKYKDYRQTPLEKLIDYGLKRIKTMPNKRLKTLILNEKQELEIINYKK
ncbi:uncharacterized protein LOC125064886 [Vanessa atalanta]|uniref:uncharacterized protein LOC125064886 n=1 Tax=Vanessa atalanta TaxID=42275 RepID=UPI001FCCD6EA|nr:uncharacterized protein LOC125064886 [Vanessa atalanta]